MCQSSVPLFPGIRFPIFGSMFRILVFFMGVSRTLISFSTCAAAASRSVSGKTIGMVAVPESRVRLIMLVKAVKQIFRLLRLVHRTQGSDHQTADNGDNEGQDGISILQFCNEGKAPYPISLSIH